MSFKSQLAAALQNLSGKTFSSTGTTTEMLTAFNALYSCAVTFATTPSSGVTIVVKKGTTVISPDEDGVYHLLEGNYTYSASIAGYVTQTDVALAITNADETTGTKEVAVTMNKFCVVTFTKTPTAAVIVVKLDGVTVAAEANGTYKLVADTYTYDLSADGYVTKTAEELVISAGDATTGTKAVSVSLVKYCVVTFAPKDSVTEDPITGATIVVKLGGDTVTAEANGTYKLVADTYAYDISKTGYVTQEAVELVISAGDATTGTKTVEPVLVADGG